MAVVSGPRPRARVAPRPRPFAEPRESLLERAGVLRLDFPLLGAALALIAFSVFILVKTSPENATGQLIFAVVGIAAMLAIARVDYSRFRELRVGIYTALIASICLVFVFAEATRGSHRWIDLGFFRF